MCVAREKRKTGIGFVAHKSGLKKADIKTLEQVDESSEIPTSGGDMVEYFAQHLDHLFYALAGICLLTDFYLLRKSGPLLCIGIGSLITGLFITVGLIEHLRIALVMLAGFSAASAGLLWDRIKQQDDDDWPETPNDMLGKIVPASARITKTEGRVFYLGVEWLARLDSSSAEPIEVDTPVQVTRVEGTIMLVRVV
jgi:membrane protein implicated in regulation of membrane protease activity